MSPIARIAASARRTRTSRPRRSRRSSSGRCPRSWMVMSTKNPPSGQERHRRRLHVAQRRAEQVRAAHLAARGSAGSPPPSPVVHRWKPTWNFTPVAPTASTVAYGRGPVEGDRLLAEDVLSGRARRGPRGRRGWPWGGDGDRLYGGVAQHLLDVGGPRHSVRRPPRRPARVGVGHDGELGRPAARSEVSGVDPAHPAQADQRDCTTSELHRAPRVGGSRTGCHGQRRGATPAGEAEAGPPRSPGS